MEVSVLEAKRLRQRGVLVLSWVLLVASVALSTLLQIAVAPPSLVGYLTAGATPVWLLGLVRGAEPALPRPAPREPRRRRRRPGRRRRAGRRAGQQARARPRRRTPRWLPPASRSPAPGWPRPPASRPATAAPCWPSSKPTPPPPSPTGTARARPGPSHDRHGHHLADLPGLRRLVRAARRPRPQARVLLAGLPAGRLPRPPTRTAARTSGSSAPAAAGSGGRDQRRSSARSSATDWRPAAPGQRRRLVAARERYQRANAGGNGAGQRQQYRSARHGRHRAAGGGAKVRCPECGGLRAPHTVHHDQAAHERARRRYEALLRKAAGTTFEARGRRLPRQGRGPARQVRPLSSAQPIVTPGPSHPPAAGVTRRPSCLRRPAAEHRRFVTFTPAC